MSGTCIWSALDTLLPLSKAPNVHLISPYHMSKPSQPCFSCLPHTLNPGLIPLLSLFWWYIWSWEPEHPLFCYHQLHLLCHCFQAVELGWSQSHSKPSVTNNSWLMFPQSSPSIFSTHWTSLLEHLHLTYVTGPFHLSDSQWLANYKSLCPSLLSSLSYSFPLPSTPLTCLYICLISLSLWLPFLFPFHHCYFFIFHHLIFFSVYTT